MYVGWSDIALRVDQRRPFIADAAGGVHVYDRNLDDAVVACREQPSCLQIEHCVSEGGEISLVLRFGWASQGVDVGHLLKPPCGGLERRLLERHEPDGMNGC